MKHAAEFENVFSGMAAGGIYEMLMGRSEPNCQVSLPRWPSEDLQKGYTGAFGPFLVSRALAFITMIEKDGAFVDNWKGLDYGCGWGRISSLLLSRGHAEQLDMCDAWQKTLDLVAKLNYSNKIMKVSEVLKNGEIAKRNYDFIMAFSVFTHLSLQAFENNIKVLMEGLKPQGTIYFTVRHGEFLSHKYSNVYNEAMETLNNTGFWFVPTSGDIGNNQVFGDTVVSEKFMKKLGEKIGKIRYLGRPHEKEFQHTYALSQK